ncbi:DUF4198 domain-containing protein [Thermosulfurimonas sp. F29]|uniref:DUF4198 domain-containing protein n=1 Tax=Thermosulfurimonas sp. F29 TaxID=2867247 RepID=UPI001C82F81A|nr:DUF4198 domain-containing protein [Thermosulfurimonas sp. F29]MBX6423111.1 DUF4198 domain-containing protein [Thermosulfurimonas sp. F29]
MKKLVILGSLCLGFFILANPARGHDLWLYTPHFYFSPGETVNLKICFGHNFPHDDLIIPPESLSPFVVLSPSGKKFTVHDLEPHPLSKKPRSRKGFVLARFTPPEEGVYVVGTARVRRGTPEQVPSGKYAKAIIVVGQNLKGSFTEPLGYRLEIIPLKNPALIKPGEELPVRIMFDGKPLSTFVYATYAGYWSEKEPFPVITRSDARGIARIKIARPGVWMVVCNHRVDFSASLTFEVRD